MEEARANLEKLDLTADEVDKFEAAFKDPEFKKMFMEYAQEISDPKNKAETDAYLRQLEHEGKVESVYGAGVQLIAPEPGFAAKTRDETTGAKAFVNICHSEKCDPATSEKRPGGVQWSVPHTLGQPHEEADKRGDKCVAYDFCVADETYELATRDERFKRMVVETAIEAINTTFATKLAAQFTLPKKAFMGPKEGPGVHAIKPNKDGSAKKGGPPAPAADPGARVAPLTEAADRMGPPNDGERTTARQKASAFSFDKAVKANDASGRSRGGAAEGSDERAGEPAGECEPKFAVIHRAAGADLSASFGAPGSRASREVEKRRSARPDFLVVRVETPKISGIAEAELDVGDWRLAFRVPGKYALDLTLPFEVRGEEGAAKFDKAARRLEVTLPVKPATFEPARAFEEVKSEGEDEEKEEKEDEEEEEEAQAYAAREASASPPGADDAEARAAASAKAAVEAKEAFEASGETENQRLWREMHEKRAAEAAAKAREDAEAAGEVGGAAAGDDAGGASDGASDDRAPADPEPTEPATASAAPPRGERATFLRPSLAGSALEDELD